MKDKLAKKKKMEKAIQKWESGKLALECITVEIDNSVIQRGSIGGLFEYGELSCITKKPFIVIRYFHIFSLLIYLHLFNRSSSFKFDREWSFL